MNIADIKAHQKNAKNGTANSTRLWNYQILILLHYARIGVHVVGANQSEREVIKALADCKSKGLFDG